MSGDPRSFLHSSGIFFWVLFFISAQSSLFTHIDEGMSFDRGQFSLMSTVIWPVSSLFLGFAFLLTGLSLIMGRENERKKSLPSSLFLGWTLFFFFSTFSSFVNGFSGPALIFLFQWLLLGLIAYALSMGSLPFSSLIRVFTLLGVFEVVLGLFETLPSLAIPYHFPIGDPVLRSSSGEILRATGTFLHPNILGFFLVMTYFLSTEESPRLRTLRWVILLGIILTFSRTAFLALLIGGIFYFLGSRDKKIGIAVFVSAFVIFLSGFFLRYTLDEVSPSNTERISQTSAAFHVIEKNPVFGVGIARSPVSLNDGGTTPPWNLEPVHNTFLHIASESGLPAAASWALLLLATGLVLFRGQKYILSPCIFGLFGTVLVFAFFDHLLLTSLPGMILFGVFGGLLLLLRADEGNTSTG